MASIDPASLVVIDLSPVFTLDTTIEASIPAKVDAQCALKGWSLADLDDARAVYVAMMTTKSFITRLLLKFSLEVKKVKGGKAETEFVKAIDYLEALRDELTEELKSAAVTVDPEAVETVSTLPTWTGVGPLGW